MTRKKSRPNESCCEKRKVAETERGFKERSCRDTVLYVATLKENNFGRNIQLMSRRGMVP